MRRAFIASLFYTSSPTNIARLIMTVVVDAIERVPATWLAADLSEKLVERLKTKFNAAAAVVGILFAVRIIAASFRTQKGSVLGRFYASSLFAVFVIDRGGKLAQIAAAGKDVAFAKIARTDLFKHAAIALAKPVGTVRAAADIFDGDKTPKPLICNVYRAFA